MKEQKQFIKTALSDDFVVSRVPSCMWILPVILAVLGLIYVPITRLRPGCSRLDVVMPWFFALFLLTFAVLLAYWFANSWIRICASGVSFVKRRKVQTIPWEGITDYYLIALSGKSGTTPAFESKLGIVHINPFNKSADEFYARFQSMAVNSKTRGWAIKGTRLEIDGPQEFRYDAKSKQTAILFCCIVSCIWVILMGYGAVSFLLHLPKLLPYVGWLPTILMVFVLISYVLLFPTMAAFALMTPAEWRKRIRQHIVANSEGITAFDHIRAERFVWEEVTDYFQESYKKYGIFNDNRFVICCGHERIDFQRQIDNLAVLKEVIQERSVNAPRKHWPASRGDQLVKPGRFQISFSETTRRFDYRTRSMRALLVFPTFISFVILWIALYRHAHDIFEFGIACLSGTLFFWIFWWTSSLTASPQGIRKDGLFGSRSVGWSEVVSVKKVGAEYSSGVLLRTRHGKLWVSAFLADYEGLEDLIEKNVPGCKLDDVD